jgi:hypothetical protein
VWRHSWRVCISKEKAEKKKKETIASVVVVSSACFKGDLIAMMNPAHTKILFCFYVCILHMCASAPLATYIIP